MGGPSMFFADSAERAWGGTGVGSTAGDRLCTLGLGAKPARLFELCSDGSDNLGIPASAFCEVGKGVAETDKTVGVFGTMA